jgi:DNA-directed RNA polymerase subunit H (RpoH/RPB5)
MGDAAQHLLQSFEALSETERREVLEELLRRAAELPYSFPTDDELVRAADQVFQDIDRREAKG